MTGAGLGRTIPGSELTSRTGKNRSPAFATTPFPGEGPTGPPRPQLRTGDKKGDPDEPPPGFGTSLAAIPGSLALFLGAVNKHRAQGSAQQAACSRACQATKGRLGGRWVPALMLRMPSSRANSPLPLWREIGRVPGTSGPIKRSDPDESPTGWPCGLPIACPSGPLQTLRPGAISGKGLLRRVGRLRIGAARRPPQEVRSNARFRGASDSYLTGAKI